MKKLNRKCEIFFPILVFNPVVGKWQHGSTKITIPPEHTDRLEKIVWEFLCCYREIRIAHESGHSVYFKASEFTDCNDTRRLPPFRNLWNAIEQGLASPGCQFDFEYQKENDGSYKWSLS